MGDTRLARGFGTWNSARCSGRWTPRRGARSPSWWYALTSPRTRRGGRRGGTNSGSALARIASARSSTNGETIHTGQAISYAVEALAPEDHGDPGEPGGVSAPVHPQQPPRIAVARDARLARPQGAHESPARGDGGRPVAAEPARRDGGSSQFSSHLPASAGVQCRLFRGEPAVHGRM